MDAREPVSAATSCRERRRARSTTSSSTSRPTRASSPSSRGRASSPRRAGPGASRARVEFRAQMVLPIRYVLDLSCEPDGARRRLDVRRGRDRHRLGGRLALRRPRATARRRLPRGLDVRAPLPGFMLRKVTDGLVSGVAPTCSWRSSARSRKRQTASRRLARDVGVAAGRRSAGGAPPSRPRSRRRCAARPRAARRRRAVVGDERPPPGS